MLSPKLYKASGYYNAVMKLLGYERGIDLFLKESTSNVNRAAEFSTPDAERE